MPLTIKEKEVTAVGISVAAGCKPCTNYHVKAAREAGASIEKIKQAVAEALSVRNGSSKIMEDYALARLGEPGHDEEIGLVTETNRDKELVSLGAAFAVNCVSNLKKHVSAAEAVCISQEEIAEILKLSKFIKGKGVLSRGTCRRRA